MTGRPITASRSVRTPSASTSLSVWITPSPTPVTSFRAPFSAPSTPPIVPKRSINRLASGLTSRRGSAWQSSSSSSS